MSVEGQIPTHAEKVLRTSSLGNSDRKTNRKPLDSLDLVYPFWMDAGGGGGGGGEGGDDGSTSTINVDPAGPIILENNTLYFRHQAPLTVTDRSLGLSISDPLSVNGDALTLRLIAPLSINTQSLSISTVAPLTTRDNSLGVNADEQTLELAGSDGKIGVKLDPDGPIVRSQRGITLQLDSTHFRVTGNTLTFIPSPTDEYISPYVTLEVGNRTLNTFNGQVCSDRDVELSKRIWNVSYYVFEVNSGGIVNGTINICLSGDHVGTYEADSTETGLNFTFVLCMRGVDDPEANLSVLERPTITPPSASSAQYLIPYQSGTGFLGLPKYSLKQKWYVPLDQKGLQFVEFMPIGAGTDFQKSVCGISSASVGTLDQPLGDNVMVFTYSLKPQQGQPNWFDNSATGHSVTSGPLPYSYPSAVYLPNRHKA